MRSLEFKIYKEIEYIHSILHKATSKDALFSLIDAQNRLSSLHARLQTESVREIQFKINETGRMNELEPWND